MNTLFGQLSRRPLALALLATVLILVLVATTGSTTSSGANASHTLTSASAQAQGANGGLMNVQNSTLGFGAILMLSLTSRTDRQDSISLISSLCDMQVTHMIPGVVTDEISPKAYPYGPAMKKLSQDEYKPYLGSWRSHMNAFKYIIDNKIETALIIEDDVDWDINIKSQLTEFARGLRASKLRRPFSQEELARAPYGLDWDIMHLATSKVHMAPPPRDVAFTVYNDPYRAPDDTVNNGCMKGDTNAGWFCFQHITKHCHLNQTNRAIFPSYESVGLSAIAVSYRGAQRLLYHLSYKELIDTLDYSIMNLIKDGNLRGWTVSPPIMSEWKIKGASDSDLKTLKSLGNSGGNMAGISAGIMHSARKALTEHLEGDDYWKSEAPYWNAANSKGQGPSSGALPTRDDW
ncbi:hypothetical protein V1512DRAFT_264063 [Lipomyces arxii]|uniref:uncharacterized protein n=1 Tax=Lipomyces arxii TaxID=56418 RepID=UPI0034CE6C6A